MLHGSLDLAKADRLCRERSRIRSSDLRTARSQGPRAQALAAVSAGPSQALSCRELLLLNLLEEGGIPGTSSFSLPEALRVQMSFSGDGPGTAEGGCS